MTCRVVITHQPQLANLPCVIWPWPMRVVGVLPPQPLLGLPAGALLEWSSCDVDATEAFHWTVGTEPRRVWTLQDLVQAREAARVSAALTARVEAAEDHIWRRHVHYLSVQEAPE